MNIQRNVTATEPTTETRDELASSADDYGVSLTEIVRVLRVRRNLIIGTAIAVIVLTVAVVMQLTPLYTANAIVMLDTQRNNVEDVGAVLSGLPDNQSTIQNQVQILTSLELANRVVTKLKLDQDPELNSSAGWRGLLKYLNPFSWLPAPSKTQANVQGMDLERSAVVHSFLNSVTVTPIGLSTAITISFSSTDPVKASRIANGIADAYVTDQLEAKFEATQKATQWLSGRIGDLSKQAQLADAAVQQYKASHNITQTASGSSVVQQQIIDINSQLIVAQGALSEKESQYANLEALARAGRAADAPQVVASPLIGALRAQEADLMRQTADLNTKYSPLHPKMLDLAAQKANLDAKIAEEIQRIVESAHNEALVAGAHVGALKSSLSQIEQRGAGQDQAAVQLTALQSAATSARSMYEAFLGRLNQTQGQEGIQTPDARVISGAEIPTSPSFPKKTLWIELSVPIGIVLGLMLAFAAERLDTGFRTTAQIERLLGIPVLSTVPEMAGMDTTMAVIAKPMSSFAEAIRGVQLGLTLSNIDKHPKIVMVTSSVPGEGKTTLALSLARNAAKAGQKVVIVDGDLRRPNISKTTGFVDPKNGLIEVLTDQISLDQAIIKDPHSEAFVLPCLHSPANPADLLGSEAMRRLLANLSKAFDLVIIDSAPVLPVNDTKILSQFVDTLLFVVRWEHTPREAVISSMRSLADVHAPIAGIALTRADLKRSRYYSYGYQNYYNYDKYYSS